VFASVLFLVDGRKADALMLGPLTTSLFLHLYAFSLYLVGGMPSLHVVLSEAPPFGKTSGMIVDPMSVCAGFVVII